MPSPTVAVTRDGPVTIVTLDLPASLNVLDAAMRAALGDACEAASEDDETRVVVFEGAGGVFASGMESPPGKYAPVGAAARVAAMRKPTIAWTDGVCLDMGLELALACDVRFASPGSTFGMGQVRTGALPWDGGTQRLARLVGRGQALRLLLTGETITAEEALRIGLVQQLGDRTAALELAERMAAGAPIAVAYAKEAALAGLDLTLDQGLSLEGDLSVLLQSTADRAEGIQAFKEKRSPEFEGR